MAAWGEKEGVEEGGSGGIRSLRLTDQTIALGMDLPKTNKKKRTIQVNRLTVSQEAAGIYEILAPGRGIL